MLNYNLKSVCIRIADTGFSAAFESDKTSTRGDSVKHHTVLVGTPASQSQNNH